MQMVFTRSVDPVAASEHSITRMTVATIAEADQHDSELGNAHAHSLFDKLTVAANDPSAPARDFAACSVLFDGQPLEVGKSIAAAPGVTLIRRC